MEMLLQLGCLDTADSICKIERRVDAHVQH